MRKFHPILYSTPMVQAVLRNRKTKTRRTKGLEILNDNPDRYIWLNEIDQMDIPREAIPFDDKFYYAFTGKHNNTFLHVITCPYGKVGDVLWVRETTMQESITDEEPFTTIYKADVGAKYPKGSNKWKPSIFMPKAACRIFLEITDVRPERLQDITEEDAIKEGIEISMISGRYVGYGKELGKATDSPIKSFKSLWESINGADSWEANPWVWVIEFKKIDRPEKFLL